MGYENTSGLPFSGNLPFKGSANVNGEPVNRSNAGYKTVGGFILSSDGNNTGLTANFGVVLSSLPSGETSSFAIGKPAGYKQVGVLMANNDVLQNEPFKAGYQMQDIPSNAIYEGTVRYQAWTATQTGALAVPVRGCQIIYRAVTGGTAGCDIGAIEFLPAGTAIPASFAAFPGYIVEYDARNGVAIELNFDNNVDAEASNLLPYGTPFEVIGTLTSAAAATPITLIPDSAVPAGKKVYVTNAFAKVNGATVWATTANVFIQDSAPVVGITMAVAALTANAFVSLTTANVTVGAPVATGVGFTAARGIQIAGNANGTGSDLIVTVTGFIR